MFSDGGTWCRLYRLLLILLPSEALPGLSLTTGTFLGILGTKLLAGSAVEVTGVPIWIGTHFWAFIF